MPRKRIEQNGSSLDLNLEGSSVLPVDISKVGWQKSPTSKIGLGYEVMIECGYSLYMHDDTDKETFLKYWNEYSDLLWRCSKQHYACNNGIGFVNSLDTSKVLRNILISYREDCLAGFARLLRTKLSLALGIIQPVYADQFVPLIATGLKQKTTQAKAEKWFARHGQCIIERLDLIYEKALTSREIDAIEGGVRLLKNKFDLG